MPSSNQELKEHLDTSDAKTEVLLQKLIRFLDNGLEEILGSLDIGETQGLESARILGSIFAELEKKGLSGKLAEFKLLYAEELRFLNKGLEAATPKDAKKVLGDADRVIVDALIDNSFAKIANKVTDYGLDIQSTVMQSVITGQQPDYRAIKEDAGERLAGQIRTEVNTGLATFNRTITAVKAQELGFELMIYLGPRDSLTRKFCKDLLLKDPPIYTIEEIKAMDNESDLSVLTSGGGYNCRHNWRPISIERARERGYGG